MHLQGLQTLYFSDRMYIEKILLEGCCDNTNNGPHYVNAASKHDGPSDTTDEPPFLGHNRNVRRKIRNDIMWDPVVTADYLNSAFLVYSITKISQWNSGLVMQYMTAAAPMQGTYIPQYTPVPPTAVPIEGVVADTSPQTVASSSQEASGQQQQMTVETSSEHAPAYSYQQSKKVDDKGTVATERIGKMLGLL
ncbi:hypothetical protein DUI87_18416 [Hirundo rustica rustica]|uniref:Uncharacterized protein n=1 Tax=Hirundo rustica rustica TaxID=333673 RepID=A0A3M0JW07_HIRRU|nr:hypothetical protein DUI87_18416 [Hirundo rustica rustica]